jgi:phosphohistidine phosphatase
MEGVRKVPETVRSVLMIGHNPGLHELALALAGPAAAPGAGGAGGRLAEGFPTGALAEFTIAAPWRAVAEGGGRLVRFLSPRDLMGETEPPR